MNTGAHSPPLGAFRARVSGATLAGSALALAALAGLVSGFEILRPLGTADAGARAAIETTIALSAIAGAALFLLSFQHDRRLPDLLLLSALVAVAMTDFVYCAVPVLAGGVGSESGGGARLGCELIVALAFAAAAFAPQRTLPGSDRGVVTLAAGGGAALVLLAELLERVTRSHWYASVLGDVGMAGAARHPVALALTVASAAVLIISGAGFLGHRRRGGCVWGLLAGASFLLAGARLQYLAMPAVATDWVTPREGFRLGAYILLLAAAQRQYAATRRAKAHAAITTERERIARDLHDGLAQDLACIATQGQRLDTQLGPQHPLIVATRQALAASRGAIADLTASAAPSTEAALRLVADDLEHRYGVNVEVRTETDTVRTLDSYLEPGQRDELVRIAREAIVNAALHGTANHIDVVLLHKGKELLMRVSDDGRGITDADRSGFGLRTMRARAASLGGQLSARPKVEGGPELELLVS